MITSYQKKMNCCQKPETFRKHVFLLSGFFSGLYNSREEERPSPQQAAMAFNGRRQAPHPIVCQSNY